MNEEETAAHIAQHKLAEAYRTSHITYPTVVFRMGQGKIGMFALTDEELDELIGKREEAENEV